MRATICSALIAAGLIVANAAALGAQTLADVAKKEEERRKQTPSSGKVYTNKDLSPVPPASEPPPASSTPADDKAAADKPADAKDATSDKTKDAAGEKPKDADVKKDQAYWSGRMKAAREAVDRDTTLAEAMQSRINALTTDFVNRDDPAQRSVIERDRQRALAELERLKKQIDTDKKAIADLEEEARRAGVPPDWLR